MFPSFLSSSSWNNTTTSAVGGIAISIAYGLQIQETDDPHINRAKIAADSILDITGGGVYLVDIFPILRHVPSWVPGAVFQKQAEVFRKLQENFRHLPYEETIRNIVRLFVQIISRVRMRLMGDRPLELLSPHLW